MKEIQAGKVKIGGDGPFALIAGPCVIESEPGAVRHAAELKKIAGRLGIPFIFKSSYDKANRTSSDSYRGPGLKKGLAILKKIKESLGLPVLSDVHCRNDMKAASKVLDVIQIPAFLCRQTDLVVAAADTGRVVNIKKGQFLAPWDMQHVIAKIEAAGGRKILVTERGISFGYNNLVSDFRSIPIMRSFGYPVVYDATHSVQMPGALGGRSGGDRKFVPYLSAAAVACGADAIFMEVHEDPDNSPSDGANMVRLGDLEDILLKLKRINKAVGAGPRARPEQR